MSQHIYINFLHNKKVYKLNEAYYARLFRSITAANPHPFYQTRFNNGEPFYDGNPMFSVLYQGRVLRIVQEEPESERPYFKASIGRTPDDKWEELVIFLELSKETIPPLKEAVKQWFVEKRQATDMAAYLQNAALS